MNEKNLKPFQKGNKASVGYGRPKVKEEVKAVKDANYNLLNDLIKAGTYNEIMLEVIENQRKQGKIDCLKFLSESVIGKEPVKIPNAWNEFAEELG